MAAEVRNELLGQLLGSAATGVELREASEKKRRLLAAGAWGWVAGETTVVQVERVLKRCNGAGEVAPQPLPLLGRRRTRSWLTGAGGVGAGGE